MMVCYAREQNIIQYRMEMKQICDGYNPRVFMGNWYEESFSVPQPSRDNPMKVSRPAEIDIGYVDAHLHLKSINRIARLQPWNTTKLVGDPLFHTKGVSASKENFDLKTTSNHFKIWRPHLYGKEGDSVGGPVRVSNFPKDHLIFNEHNVNELLQSRPTAPLDFKNLLRANTHENNRKLLETVYQQEFTLECPKKQSCPEQEKSLNFRRMRSDITLAVAPIRSCK